MQVIPASAVRQWRKANGVRSPISISTVCPYCNERAVFSLASHLDDEARLATAATASCPGCTRNVQFWAVRHKRIPNTDENNPTAVYMYPPAQSFYPTPDFLSHLPDALQRSFISAIEALNSKNYVATAVCSRRTLEGIFKYLLPTDHRNSSLAKLIQSARDKVDLAAPLTTLSHAVRGGGNLGAHFDADREPDEKIARQMVELLGYLISYLYVLPKEISKLEESLEKESVKDNSSPSSG